MSASNFQVFARDGWRIPADMGPDPSPNAVALASDPNRVVLASAARLAPPTGRYNCHGLVFASRRARIPPVETDVDIDEVLDRDGYRRVRDGGAQVGDVVAYRLEDEIEHTGFVSRVERVGSAAVVFVWSAWGGLGEFEHRVQASPYKGEPEYRRLK